MPEDQNQYGRRRVKRAKLTPPPAAETAPPAGAPELPAPVTPAEPDIFDTQTSLAMPEQAPESRPSEPVSEIPPPPAEEPIEEPSAPTPMEPPPATPTETPTETPREPRREPTESRGPREQRQRRPDRPERTERSRPQEQRGRGRDRDRDRDRERPPRAPERAERPERPERPERLGRSERSERTERPERQARPERPERRFGERGRVRISVIIPAYNEEPNIKPLLDQFNEIIHRAGNDWEVVLVNDGSTDKTLDRARDAAIHYHWLRVVTYPQNRGLTAALEAGFQQARGSIFVFYPADMQYHPQDIPRMINRIDRGADLVTGWKQGKYQKRFVSFIYNGICRRLFNLKVHDLNSVKAFRKEALGKITLRQDWHRYLAVMAAEAGFTLDEVKVNVYPRNAGKSKFGTGRILGGVLDLISVKFQLSFTKKPFRFFGSWGIASIFIGFLLGLIGLYLRFFTNHGSRLWLFLVILFVLAGLMLFSLGFLAEVIVALREDIEISKKKR